MAKRPGWLGWWFIVHNLVAHPLLAIFWWCEWPTQFHDWTADRMGAETKSPEVK